jgi:hypothetical protein
MLVAIVWQLLPRSSEATPPTTPEAAAPEPVAEATPPQPEPAPEPVAAAPLPEAAPAALKRAVRHEAPKEPSVAAPPPPEEAPAVATGGPNVTIDGIERAYLLDAARKTWQLPASVPPGRYTLYVFWDPDKATATKNVVVDGATSLHCVPNLRMCQ